MQAKLWEIGPIINGTNSSSGLPLNPQANPDGFVIQFPQPNASIGHLHYVTALSASLQGKRWIRMKFRIETDPDVKILPTKYPDFPSMLTLYFQREGDDWSGVGKYETYRWWASFKSQTPLIAGNYEIIAPFDQKWTAVQTSDALTNNTAFNDALLHANRVGFTLGGGDGLGHGVYATGNAKIVVTEFVVE